MRLPKSALPVLAALLPVLAVPSIVSVADAYGVRAIWAKLRHHHGKGHGHAGDINVQLGPRPYYIVDKMDDSELKTKLESCSEGPFEPTDFSIGHRGSAMLFPEHTEEAYRAAARMGAGILECDVTFTKDTELVCRHSQCDLHTTTNILTTDLADKCTVPPDYSSDTPFANVQCCTSDITVDEFKSLCGKMDAGNRNAATLAEYLSSTADWRTDLYADECPTLLTHEESIELFTELGVKMTPELKSPSVTMPFNGYSQEDYAAAMVEEYKALGVPARKVWVQSFDLNDVLYWLDAYPAFGKQAVFLDGRYIQDVDALSPSLAEIRDMGVNIIAPPMNILLSPEGDGYGPSVYANTAKDLGFEIITWTLERSWPLSGNPGFYYDSVLDVTTNVGDTYEALDVLGRDIGVLGVFSDWPATVTYYANCMGL